MRYTTTIWEPPITPEQIAQCEEKIHELNVAGIETTITFIDEGTRNVVIRAWADLGDAERWCNYVLGVGCKSASVDPE